MRNLKLIISFLFISVSMIRPVAITPQEEVRIANKHIKIALLLDTSNSMDGLIDQAKAQLWDIVNELSLAKCKNGHPDLTIALYEYGNDQLSASEGYIRQVLGFSSDLDEISEKLFSLTTNGGEEYCGQVIQTSLNQLDWGDDQADLKMIFIAGNEPFTQGTVPYKEAIVEAVTKGVVVNTIFCGNYERGIRAFWKDGAGIGKGEYMAIDQNKKSIHITSPYDADILKYNKKLNATYIPFGTLGHSKIRNQSVQDANAMQYSSANAVQRTISKSSHLYSNSSWDLVDAIDAKNFNYDQLNKAELPSELQGKSNEDIKAYVTLKKKERTIIQKEIQALNAKRMVYVTAQKKLNNTSDGLGNAMIEAIQKQAVKKGFWWE